MDLYESTTFECSKLITNKYSTSFSLGIRSLHKKFHLPVYAIYGFVRYADEIVDTFHDFDKEQLLNDFKIETYKAIKDKISLNPVLHSFQSVVNKYGIETELIDAFLRSMAMDLSLKHYDTKYYEDYIYGSAEVVGLMCLRVFCEDNKEEYDRLKAPAKKLGAAFQKVNFLRDIKSDYSERGRIYFPGIDLEKFNTDSKKAIEADIQKDFDEAYEGIINLPKGARMGVYLAYVYYLSLFKKIKDVSASGILDARIRIPDGKKMLLLVQSYFKYRLNYI